MQGVQHLRQLQEAGLTHVHLLHSCLQHTLSFSKFLDLLLIQIHHAVHVQGVQHLRQLQEAGLTHVHLLPSYDYGSVPERPEDQLRIEVQALCASTVPQLYLVLLLLLLSS